MWVQGLKLLCLHSFSIIADLEVILFGDLEIKADGRMGSGQTRVMKGLRACMGGFDKRAKV